MKNILYFAFILMKIILQRGAKFLLKTLTIKGNRSQERSEQGYHKTRTCDHI